MPNNSVERASISEKTQGNHTDSIGIWLVLKSDVLPWLLSAVFILLLFFGVNAFVGSARPESMSSADAQAVFFASAGIFIDAIIVLGCLLARRSRDIWTWVLAATLIIFFVPQRSINLAVDIFPNSAFQPLIAMLGLLAAGRIASYIYVRYFLKLDDQSLTIPSVCMYIVLIIGATLFITPLFFDLFWS